MPCPYLKAEKDKYAALLPTPLRRMCIPNHKPCSDIPLIECPWHKENHP